MTLRIEDYAVIGDTHTVALVGNDGSIDWLCLPRFDSTACFASLLGTDQNGSWSMAPTGEWRPKGRRYRPSTLVLETEFETSDGVVAVIDCDVVSPGGVAGGLEQPASPMRTKETTSASRFAIGLPADGPMTEKDDLAAVAAGAGDLGLFLLGVYLLGNFAFTLSLLLGLRA